MYFYTKRKKLELDFHLYRNFERKVETLIALLEGKPPGRRVKVYEKILKSI